MCRFSLIFCMKTHLPTLQKENTVLALHPMFMENAFEKMLFFKLIIEKMREFAHFRPKPFLGGRSPPPPQSPLQPPHPTTPIHWGGEVTTPPSNSLTPTPPPAFIVIYPTLCLSNSYSISTTASQTSYSTPIFFSSFSHHMHVSHLSTFPSSCCSLY